MGSFCKMNTTQQTDEFAEAVAMHKMTFPALLRHLRERQLMSMGELARQAGMAKSHISMLEAGKRRPGMKVIQGLGKALALTGDDYRLFTERALIASHRPTVSQAGRPPPDVASWRDMLKSMFLTPETGEEAAFLDAVRAKAQS
jgi:transcriptional regulator with XRE-family HTH domain